MTQLLWVLRDSVREWAKKGWFMIDKTPDNKAFLMAPPDWHEAHLERKDKDKE